MGLLLETLFKFSHRFVILFKIKLSTLNAIAMNITNEVNISITMILNLLGKDYYELNLRYLEFIIFKETSF